MAASRKAPAAHCVFEYLYRDAGNWKTFGMLLLSGAVTDEATSTITKTLDWNNTFVAEQVGIPSLCPQHFKDCGSDGPGDLDHAYHEFDALRSATEEETQTLTVFGSVDDLARKFALTRGNWNVRLSPNVDW